MRFFKTSLLVLMCTLFIIGCNAQHDSNLSNISSEEDEDELLYGKYPEPVLIAIGENPDVNKNYKELTKDDLKKVTILFFQNDFHFETDKNYPDKKYGFEDGKKYDFSILLEMPNLTVLDIDLGENIKLEDYSILKKLSKLERLYVGNVNDDDVINIAGLTSLKELNICNSKDLTSIEFLSNMEQLTFFGLYKVPNINDYQPLKHLTNVNEVHLINNELTQKDVNTFPDMDSIESLYISDNKIEYLNNFPKMEELQFLILSNNPLTEINILPDKIPNLKHLDLRSTKVSDLNKLSGVSSIESINLWDTGVKRISPLKEYKNLKYIKISPNNIEDLDVYKNSSVEVGYFDW